MPTPLDVFAAEFSYAKKFG